MIVEQGDSHRRSRNGHENGDLAGIGTGVPEGADGGVFRPLLMGEVGRAGVFGIFGDETGILVVPIAGGAPLHGKGITESVVEEKGVYHGDGALIIAEGIVVIAVTGSALVAGEEAVVNQALGTGAALAVAAFHTLSAIEMDPVAGLGNPVAAGVGEGFVDAVFKPAAVADHHAGSGGAGVDAVILGPANHGFGDAVSMAAAGNQIDAVVVPVIKSGAIVRISVGFIALQQGGTMDLNAAACLFPSGDDALHGGAGELEGAFFR